MYRVSFVLLGVLLGSAAAAAEPVANATAPTRKVCRPQTEIGSLIPKRICMTAAEWKLQDEAAKSNVDLYGAQRRARNAGSQGG